jgi:hypothetical protein
MRLVGRIGNTLFHYIDGARLFVESTVCKHQLQDIIDYTEVKSFSCMYFLELSMFGESQYEKALAVTPDDRLALLESKST